MGSSMLSPAHGCGRARATQNNSPSAQKNSKRSQARARRKGAWGEFRLAQTKAKPRRLARQRGAEQKFPLFLLPARRSLGAGGEEKIGGARKIKKCKENFSARQCRFAARRRGGAIRFFQESLIK